MAKTTTPQKAIVGNEAIADKLAAFDYRKLAGDAYHQYLCLTEGELEDEDNKLSNRVGGLAKNDLFDYEGYRVAAVKKQLYPGMKDTPIYVYGIKLMKEAPECTTRITAGAAKDLNAQIANHTESAPGLYYLIKKVTPKVD